VVAQLVLVVLVAFGPRTMTRLPALSGLYAKAAMVLGIVLMAIGGGLVVTGIANLGRNLTPLPFPKDGGELVQAGAYSLVRHPLCSSVIALAVGWACAVRGPLTMAYAVLLFLLLDAKSRREERWLETKFPSYAEYRKRVRRLSPFVY
jgi:protein-S-isoprenylcysteine O-methyltransferase Ste14